jgi:hypothetical protein
MNIRRWIGICVVLLSGELNAQPCPDLPDYTSWKKASNYAVSRDSVEKVLQWLCRTPFAVFPIERSEANACVLFWIAGTPDLRVEVDTDVLPFVKENEELLYPVIHGMALYQLRHPKEKDSVKLHVEGLKTLAALVDQSESLRKERYLREVMRAYNREELKEYVDERIYSARR